MNYRKFAFWSVGVLALVAAGFAVVFGYWAWQDGELYRQEPFTEQSQRHHADIIIETFNKHDPEQFTTLLSSSPGAGVETSNAYRRRIIQAAMPLAGCTYALDSVENLGPGSFKTQPVWAYSPKLWRYDMHITESCAGAKPLQRIIEVISGPSEGGHWSEIFFDVKQ